MATATTNPHEDLARLKKTTAIADLLLVAHAHLETDLPCSEFARGLSTETRDLLAAAAYQFAPSDTTWAAVIELLERREKLAGDIDDSERAAEDNDEAAEYFENSSRSCVIDGRLL